MNETPTPSRRRGRPPKDLTILAPPQESGSRTQDVLSVTPELTQAPTVPSPLPAVVADDVDLRETPAMAARHSEQLSGSDSKVRGVGDGYLPIDAGKVAAYPALPEQSQALTEQERIPEPAPPVPLTEAAPAAPVQTNWTPVQVGDVVQINSPRTKHYGTLFIIGDIRNHRVHGYQIGLGGKLEYFTVNEDECILVGPSTKGQVRSMSGCSAKWKAEQR